ncbi:MAG: acylneuraminate cytidylyltransferase family protein [Rickettsiales bacterium]|jgi:CMP-N,N'-diacetyllegionaminic acid synthase
MQLNNSTVFSEEIIALLTARGGSKGLVGKNMKALLDKPLIGWTIEAAKNCKNINRIILSTDDEKTADYARNTGCEVPFMRPAEFATDNASHIDVVLHFLEFMQKNEVKLPKALFVLQPTSPLRNTEDLEAAIAIYKDKSCDAVISVCEPPHHPLLSKKIDENGIMHDMFELPSAHPRRQDLPISYAPNGALFLLDVKAFLKQHKFYMKKTGAYIMPASRSVDIDTQFDFDMAEFLMQRQNRL